MCQPRRILIAFVVLLLVSVVVPPPFSSRAQSSTTKRILILYWDSKEIPANISFDQGFQAEMRSAPGDQWEVYDEYLDSRFAGDQQQQLFHDYLKKKYADRNIDVVVTQPDPPLSFLLKYRDLFANSPIVFTAVKRPSAETIAAGPGMTGLLQVSTQKETLDFALKFHPDTEQVFVISGTDERDKRFETVARQELSGFETRVHINYLTDLPLDELIEKTKNLPRRSVILYLWQRVSIGGENQMHSFELVSRIAETASAPIYSTGSRNVGNGIVGGYVQDSEQNGRKVAEIVRRIINGTRAQDIPIENVPSAPVFDWRQLKRWGISESTLPANSIVTFKEYTFWQRYKWRIVVISALFVMQTLIITLLLFERKRRQRAKEALDRLNAELEQRIAGRTAALNAKSKELETFAYSVAHDLKAPLRGIDGYGRLLLADHSAQLDDEGQMFLNTIHESTQEMSQLIDDLLEYSRLERRDFHSDQFQLGPFVSAVVEQKKRETSNDGIEFVVNVNGGVIVADRNGLTQSLRNYLDNAVKFSSKATNPRIEVGSQETAKNYLVWVRDNGVGFDMKYHDRVFDIFQRLNRSEDYPGTGVGLAIVRKSMERMGGRAWAESRPGEGATFYLEIPK